MSKITTAFILTLMVNLVFALAQLSIDDTGSGTRFYNGTNNLLESRRMDYNFSSPSVINESVADLIPDSDASDTPGAGVFTDVFTNIKNFFTTVGKGLSYLSNFLFAVPHFISGIGLPEPVSFLLGTVWLIFNAFIFLLFLWGDRS